jgi:diguanylate cyclase (GGDEF)-like protein
VIGLALIVSGPHVGWWTLIPLTVASITFFVIDRGLQTSPRPECRLGFAWLTSELAIAASVALTGGVRSPGLAWLAIPVVTLAARFNLRGVVAGSSVAGVLVLASCLVTDPADLAHRPQYVIFALALVVAVALLSLALMQSDAQHRTESVIDPLTSMLNRNALRVRAEELRAQALFVQQPIGVIVGDLDNFKTINDTHGHAAGDAVLREVAYCMREKLRAFDLAYRLGGEEFLVLLPGANASQAAGVAEDLRQTLISSREGKLPVTMSFGVSASDPSRFDYAQTFNAADRALYEAKAAGRNCVRVAGEAPDPGAPPAGGALTKQVSPVLSVR